MSEPGAKPKPAARRRARRFLVQSLYQHALSGTGIAEIERQFCQDHDMQRVDLDFYHEVLCGVDQETATLLDVIGERIDRKISELDPVALSILKLGTYELMYRFDVPYRVVINEAIELAKIFGAPDGHKYVNSILDGVAARHRQPEVSERLR